ncbi:ZN208 protein, partial [Amia calva]|nr:ZN208 protein [Amia calva]
MVDEPGWGKSVSGELKEIAEPYSAREDSLPQAACFSKFPASFSSFTTLPELESQNALNSSAYNRCPQCGKGYASAWLLKIHPCTQAVEASVAGGEDFCCSQCGKTFSGWGSLKSHQQIHNSVAAAVAKSHGCARCGKTFQLLSSLETHQQEHSEEEEEEEEVEEEQEQEGSHICHQCGKAFLSLGSLRAHQRSHVNSAGAAAGDRRNSCSQCGKSFSHVRNLKRHQRIHTGERPYCCPYCGKSFNQSNSLKTHLRLHTGERPYSCAQCGKSFIRLVCLRRHQRSHVVERERGERERLHALQDREVKEEPRDDEGDVIEVKVPDQVHVSAALLANTGLGKSPGPYPFSCPECHLVFSCPSELREHRWATHCGDRPYCCSECGRGFSQLANLKKHYLIHTGEKPHHCTQCGKSFRHLCNLNKHRLVHTGERPFPCTQCGKRFRQLPHLKEHQGVHIGAKQFHCSVCGKNVSSRKDITGVWKRHLHRETAELREAQFRVSSQAEEPLKRPDPDVFIWSNCVISLTAALTKILCDETVQVTRLRELTSQCDSSTGCKVCTAAQLLKRNNKRALCDEDVRVNQRQRHCMGSAT